MLLVTASPWRSAPPAVSPVSARITHAPPVPADARDRRMGLDSLTRCNACHAPADAPSDVQLALASTASGATRRDDPAPQRDVERVRAGGAIFIAACAACHGEHREGPLRAGTQRPGAAGAAGEPVTPLSDEQIAALAAFLRCHAAAVPLRPHRQRAMLGS